MDEKLKFVIYCGLCCELCAERARIPQQAKALQEAMAEEGMWILGNVSYSIHTM